MLSRLIRDSENKWPSMGGEDEITYFQELVNSRRENIHTIDTKVDIR